MRIRKHAKISPLVYATSLKPGAVLQPHVCQLNQSPWDVMSFSPPSTPPPPLPPPSFQGNGSDDFYRNGSLGESMTTFESAEFMKIAMDDVKIEDMKWDCSDSGVDGAAIDKAEEGAAKNDKEIAFCCKTDGKGWKCKRKAAIGNSLCEHHLSLIRNYSNWGPPATKKVDTVVADSRRRPRAKKAASTSNPYEFYYYSGFGPRWGKKRGENSQISSVSENADQDHEMVQSSLSQIDNEESYIEEEIEYEEEDEENSESEIRRKRVRKPIKARSLKSLM